MGRGAVRDLGIVLAVGWIARGVFVAMVGDAHSVDVEYWRGALEAQDLGRNPYETGVLNWPPLWLVIIVGLDTAGHVLDVSFLALLRIYLVLLESGVVATLYFTLRAAGVGRAAVRRALLVGIALNPIAILLVCQHGNSDVQIGLLVTLTVAALLAHGRSRDVVLWLVACLLLGVGVLAKTVPLVLVGILAPGARLASTAARALGTALVLGPAALGVAVILALTPRAVIDNVLLYRSTRGFFGVSGFLDEDFLGGASTRPLELYAKAFSIGAVVVVVWLARRLWREPPPSPQRLFLLVAVILLALVALGPGYGPQYAYWLIPPLVATYVLLDDGWRRLLQVGYAIAAATYAVEYAFIPWLGAYAGTGWRASDFLDDPQRLPLFRLPLLAVYVVLLIAGVARLAGWREGAIGAALEPRSGPVESP